MKKILLARAETEVHIKIIKINIINYYSLLLRHTAKNLQVT